MRIISIRQPSRAVLGPIPNWTRYPQFEEDEEDPALELFIIIPIYRFW
jgi:hypothetical protein